jgi:hypothetical protein
MCVYDLLYEVWFSFMCGYVLMDVARKIWDCYRTEIIREISFLWKTSFVVCMMWYYFLCGALMAGYNYFLVDACVAGYNNIFLCGALVAG